MNTRALGRCHPGEPSLCADPVDARVMGEALWDLTGPPGSTFAEAGALQLAPGGAAINVALALSALGHEVGLAITVGADALGDALLARVAACGVAVDLASRTPDRTGLVFVERPAGGGARVVSYRPEGEAAPLLAEGPAPRLLVVTGLLPGEAPAERYPAAARSVQRGGGRLVVDLNARPRLWRGRALAVAPAWLALASVVKASEEDLLALGLDLAALRSALDPAAVLVVTAGAGPARAIGPFDTVSLAPEPLAGLALGAGDAFTAGLCDALLRAGDPAAATGRAFWTRALGHGHATARAHLERRA